jgi:hypothetical protein
VRGMDAAPGAPKEGFTASPRVSPTRAATVRPPPPARAAF